MYVPTKTFVLEVHTDDPSGYLSDMVGESHVKPTGDDSLFRAHVSDQVFLVERLSLLASRRRP